MRSISQDSMRYNPLSRISSDDPSRASAWKEACRVAAWLKERYPDCTVRAFGSLVRPNAWSPRSDIDIAVSGISDFSWDFAWKVHEEFSKFDVNVVSTDPDLSSQSSTAKEFTRQFKEEIFATGIEIPAPMQAIACEPELIVIAKRLEMVVRSMEDELQELVDMNSAGIPDFARCDAVMYHANRYRYRLEKGIDRVVGFIDRIKIEFRERDERLRLYKVAATAAHGLRPALLTRKIAKWHSNFINKEYTLMDEEEVAMAVSEHREQLPEIHRKTVAAFSAFRDFLIAGQAKSTRGFQL